MVINLLARRQWRRTGLTTRPAKLYAARPAIANRLYRARYPAAPLLGDPAAEPRHADRSHVHVPVIELDPGQLAAGLGSRRRAAVTGTARSPSAEHPRNPPGRRTRRTSRRPRPRRRRRPRSSGGSARRSARPCTPWRCTWPRRP
ncbi:hypothetical protein ACFQY7_03945 [Actinomadura luteofluorescens]|uniref:hypothetical protein n=1 Tax=Actinomadura luteofluorescens TaxID=46163 RepID=UPI0036401BB3